MSETGSKRCRSPSSTQTHSCVLCGQRKVKCDRSMPCSNCQKAQKPCEYKTPRVPTRRPRKTPELGLHARVKHYEKLLTKLGVNLDDVTANEDAEREPSEVDSGGSPQVASTCNLQPRITESNKDQNESDRKGQLIVNSRGFTQYFENSLFRNLENELHGNGATLHDMSSDENNDVPSTAEFSNQQPANSADFIFGTVVDKTFSLHSMHPHPPVALDLWKAYLRNVNPLCKLIHVPTTENLILQNIGVARAGHMPKNLTALVFAIYLAAIMSMTDSEAKGILGESRDLAIARYRKATQVALTRARLLQTHELLVLQAYTIFLTTAVQDHERKSLWVLAGIAIRIAQRMGLQRDGRESKLPPFQVEMRRRVWWQLVILDRMVSEANGTEGALSHTYSWDTLIPLNVDDIDLYPEMTALPDQTVGATEMMYCLMRYETDGFFQHVDYRPGDEQFRSSHNNPGKAAIIGDREKVKDSLQSNLEEKFLRYCDPLNPLHYFVSIAARTKICMLHLAINHPRKNHANGQTTSPQKKKELFKSALKALEYSNLLQSSPLVQRFVWNIRRVVPIRTFVFLVHYLLSGPTGSDAQKSWEQLDQFYHHNPHFIAEPTNRLQAALRRLTFQAWAHRVKELREYSGQYDTPVCIKALLACQIKESRSGVDLNQFQNSNYISRSQLDESDQALQFLDMEGFNIDTTNIVNMEGAIGLDQWNDWIWEIN